MGKQKGKKGGAPLTPIQVDTNPSSGDTQALLQTLQARFLANMARHPAVEWDRVAERLTAQPRKLGALHAMETTGGAPDVVTLAGETDTLLFCDCSPQSPDGRRSICYDGAAQQTREKKGVYPAGNALDLAAAMGVDLMTEAQYRALQTLGAFDTTTSSWVQTPDGIRERGGALFCDRRYDHVFLYHNGAHSFYGARGFRGVLRV